MSQWLKSLVGYLLIVSVAVQMLPDKKYEQYVKLFTGFLLIILLFQPVLKIGSASAFLENKILEFVREQEQMEEAIVKKSEEFQEKSEQFEQEKSEEIEIVPIEEIEVTLNDP